MSTETVLIVDDQSENLVLLSSLLHPLYRVQVASSGARALVLARTPPVPDLILLDVMMPGMDGYEVLEHLRADPVSQQIPVIFVTALEGAEYEKRGFDIGAEDYITKPISPPILMARVKNQLAIKRVRDWLADQNSVLEQEVNRRLEETLLAQTVSIRALAHLAETRDPETGNHILRTQAYVNLLALRLRQHADYARVLTDEFIDLLTRSAPLHDIGKVGIPDMVLLKPDRLNDAEWEIMKTHCVLGSEAIERAEKDVEQEVPFLALSKEIARWHHEHWDGSGYPDGLVGEDIPLSARIMAVADVFDALISSRVYKNAIGMEPARQIIANGSGKHFDPAIVEAFLSGFESFAAIAKRFNDT